MTDDSSSSHKNDFSTDEHFSSGNSDKQKTALDTANTHQIDNNKTENEPESDGSVSSLSIEKSKAKESHQKAHTEHADDSKKKKPKKKRNTWWIKVTIISFVLAVFFSFLSELTATSEHIIIVILLLTFLILYSILFDAIGVAVTSCDDSPIIAMASRKLYGAKTAMWLVKNRDTVASICNDVIGDICGIISGACAAAVVVKVAITLDEGWQRWLAMGIAGLVSALTIGGKAFMKNVAIKNSKEFVMFVARLLAIFVPEERRRYKKESEKRKHQKIELEEKENDQESCHVEPKDSSKHTKSKKHGDN